MIFRQVDEIISRAKTQTRRVIKSGERRIFDDDHNERFVLTPGGRLKWREGYDYAVVSKRGTRGVWWSPATGDWYVPDSADDQRAGYAPLRIVITAIRQERLHDISDEDARAEGVLNYQNEIVSAHEWYAALWDSINTDKGIRWCDNPLVWVIEFEVVVPDGWWLMRQSGRFVVWDTETTGLSDDARIVSIVAVDQDGEVLLDMLINPQVPIPPDATAIHGVTDEMVTDAPTFEQAYSQIREALSGRRWVIYNKDYDVARLDFACKQKREQDLRNALKAGKFTKDDIRVN